MDNISHDQIFRRKQVPFLYEAIVRGDNLVFSTSYRTASSSFKMEIDYLLKDLKIENVGYKIAEDGLSFYK